jgi:DNA-binding ferritin-like protein
MSNSKSKPKSSIKINSPGEMILFFMGMLNTVKLYHWKTFSFATHKATDELYEDLNKYVDEFVEVMLGYHGGIRAKLPHTNMKMNDFNTPEQFKHKLDEYKKTLISYTQKLDPVQNSDLLNIRDEILASLNKTVYFLSFRGGMISK